ncbi:hypothetical protein [Streptomyces tsukubensis]|uniref:Uncharacterized protein n=1 Tax=Streptomyces tsukubensis TaxID=83656 RepID=A0A1V4A1K9_9ACTN|nr:hypothetical protein [Streptomyces tsukubensis]OON72319.1 hypothetical protein B1H18_30135 [Streptomyces tsukubensis]QFR94178.1 hypothetical protein GBW32_15350 [Streptomyces tsukubensis]
MSVTKRLLRSAATATCAGPLLAGPGIDSVSVAFSAARGSSAGPASTSSADGSGTGGMADTDSKGDMGDMSSTGGTGGTGGTPSGSLSGLTKGGASREARERGG